MKVIFLTFILAASVAGQAVPEKTDRELLIEIRGLLATRQATEFRAALILKKMDIEINAIATLEPSLDTVQDEIDKETLAQDSMIRSTRTYENNGPQPADEDGTAAEKRREWQEELEEYRNNIANRIAKIQTLEAKRIRLQKRVDTARSRLSALEAELARL